MQNYCIMHTADIYWVKLFRLGMTNQCRFHLKGVRPRNAIVKESFVRFTDAGVKGAKVAWL